MKCYSPSRLFHLPWSALFTAQWRGFFAGTGFCQTFIRYMADWSLILIRNNKVRIYIYVVTVIHFVPHFIVMIKCSVMWNYWTNIFVKFKLCNWKSMSNTAIRESGCSNRNVQCSKTCFNEKLWWLVRMRESLYLLRSHGQCFEMFEVTNCHCDTTSQFNCIHRAPILFYNLHLRQDIRKKYFSAL